MIASATYAARLAQAHGAFNVMTGGWPLVSMTSFERVTGPKADRWLVQTVGGLMVAGGLAQATAHGAEGVATARRLGIGMATTFAAIDLVHASRGRISRVYLADAAMELAWLGLWAAARPARD